MNYIKHLNAAFLKIIEDSRLNPTHVSLYVALFQFWNISRFSDCFYLNRQEVMKLSKIGSKATYHRCLQQLNNWEYIKYLPSHNPFKGSQVKMLIFDTTSEQVANHYETSNEQALVSNTNNKQTIENSKQTKLPKNEMEVIDFFKSKEWSATEALKFYNHYQAIGWKIGGKIKIVDWRASAGNWVLKAGAIENEKELSQNKDNLRTTKEKDYGQPL